MTHLGTWHTRAIQENQTPMEFLERLLETEAQARVNQNDPRLHLDWRPRRAVPERLGWFSTLENWRSRLWSHNPKRADLKSPHVCNRRKPFGLSNLPYQPYSANRSALAKLEIDHREIWRLGFSASLCCHSILGGLDHFEESAQRAYRP